MLVTSSYMIYTPNNVSLYKYLDIFVVMNSRLQNFITNNIFSHSCHTICNTHYIVY